MPKKKFVRGTRKLNRYATTSTGRRIKVAKRTNRQILNRLKSSIEKKHYDKNETLNFSSEQTAQNLCLMPQGDSSSTRTGLKIYAKTLIMRGTIQWAKTNTQETNARLIVFMDKNSNGTTPAIASLLETVDVTSLLDNRNEGRRFVVLWDKVFTNTNPSTSVDKEQYFQKRIKLNKNVWYLDSSANSTAQGKNQFYYVTISDVTGSSGDRPTGTMDTRVYYDDM